MLPAQQQRLPANKTASRLIAIPADWLAASLAAVPWRRASNLPVPSVLQLPARQPRLGLPAVAAEDDPSCADAGVREDAPSFADAGARDGAAEDDPSCADAGVRDGVAEDDPSFADAGVSRDVAAVPQAR